MYKRQDLNDISWTAKTYDEEPITATSLLYPDSTDESARNVTTTRLQLAFETLYGSYCITERPKMIYNESTKQFVLLWHADGPLYNSKDLSGWVAGGCVGTVSYTHLPSNATLTQALEQLEQAVNEAV